MRNLECKLNGHQIRGGKISEDEPNQSLINNGRVRKHSKLVVFEIWLFTIIIFLLLIIALPLLRDFIYDFMGIYGDQLFETPELFFDLHIIIGFILTLVGILHIAIHAGAKKKEMLMKRPIKDIKAFFHSFFYLFGLSRTEEAGGGEKYSSRQRVVYLALIYNIGLLSISGITLYIISPTSEFAGMFKLTHIISAIFLVLILIFHFLINLRHHDGTALKCSYVTGTLPLGYIKKNHKIWFKTILNHERNLTRRVIKQYQLLKTSDPVADAFIKMYALNGIALSVNDAEKLANKFKSSSNTKEIKKFIEISNTI
jgi:hypothetical protein